MIGEWKQRVLETIAMDDELSKLLWYNTEDALSRDSLTEEQKYELVDSTSEHRRIYPTKYTKKVVMDQQSFIGMGIAGFAPQEVHYQYSDTYVIGYLYFYILVDNEIMDIDEGQKPDLILLFGLKKTEGMVSHYYLDKKNKIWVGEVPYTDKTTYFGYMKKMCLTLHNLHQINNGRLPIHGSMLKIRFTNGKEKNVVFFGDSGAGKSESIEALQEIADDKIVDMETIFDDMGSFTIGDDGKLYAQGTETGAFVRLDDLSSAVAFNNMDRGVYLNPERQNARVIIPADTYEHVVEHHPVDMWLYANNYSDEVGIHQFDTEDEAKKVFIAGKRKALGTTDEVGMSSTFFANPFGPVQEQEKTQPIIDKVFNNLFNANVYVGEIYTHLGNDKSKDALKESAQELLDILMNN